MAEPDSNLRKQRWYRAAQRTSGRLRPEAGYVARAGLARAGFRIHPRVALGPDRRRLTSRGLQRRSSSPDGPRWRDAHAERRTRRSTFPPHETRSLTERIKAYLGRAAVLRLLLRAGSACPQAAAGATKGCARCRADKTALAFKGPASSGMLLINLE
jgi:hypothetical protein